MNPKLLTTLDKVLDDVIDILEESDWADEAAWYHDLRATLLGLDPDSADFTELLVELERSFLEIGSFMDVPLAPKETLATVAETLQVAIESQRQQWGLISCASGIIQQIKKEI
ncbi:MAG: hypothetical protein ABI333_20685, partial [bacterium]